LGITEHKKHARIEVGCAVVTVSTTRNLETDGSGKKICAILSDSGHNIIHYSLVKDDISEIRDTLKTLMDDGEVQTVILTGGTGIGKKDVTVEAVRPLLEKFLPGFGELFRYLSYHDVGSPAILSRAMAGVCRNKLVICLPGSTGACELAMNKLIVPELGHMVYELGK
jgi:molybdenum cofactor biosynthesis protein B